MPAAAVRQARDKIAHDSVPGVIGPDGIARLPNPPGAQSSPEMASLAASYMEHEDPNVRSLAATVLRLVRTD